MRECSMHYSTSHPPVTPFPPSQASATAWGCDVGLRVTQPGESPGPCVWGEAHARVLHRCSCMGAWMLVRVGACVFVAWGAWVLAHNACQPPCLPSKHPDAPPPIHTFSLMVPLQHPRPRQRCPMLDASHPLDRAGNLHPQNLNPAAPTGDATTSCAGLTQPLPRSSHLMPVPNMPNGRPGCMDGHVGNSVGSA